MQFDCYRLTRFYPQIRQCDPFTYPINIKSASPTRITGAIIGMPSADTSRKSFVPPSPDHSGDPPRRHPQDTISGYLGVSFHEHPRRTTYNGPSSSPRFAFRCRNRSQPRTLIFKSKFRSLLEGYINECVTLIEHYNRKDEECGPHNQNSTHPLCLDLDKWAGANAGAPRLFSLCFRV